MQVPQIWTQMPSPWERRSFLRGMPQGGAVIREWDRETRSGWASAARPAGLAPRPPWSCTVSVQLGSLGETHTCVKPESSCLPVCPCQGGPRSGRNTAGNWRTREKQTGLPELPDLYLRSSRDGVAILWGMWAVVRVHRLHDWAPPECGQHAAIWITSVICSFRICPGESLLRWTPLTAPWCQPGTNKRWKAIVEISTLLIHSAPKQKSDEWMHLSPFYTHMHGEWLRYTKSTI